MRVVAGYAVHPAFHHRVMLGQVELGLGLEVTLEAWLGVCSRIDNELPAPATHGEVLAAGTVAGFAAVLLLPGPAIEAQPCMRTGRKTPRIIGMTFQASPIPDKARTFDARWRNDRGFQSGTRYQCKPAGQQAQGSPT